MEFYCDVCDYYTNKKTNYNRHINSVKHLKIVEKLNKKIDKAIFFCDTCDKQYASRSGLWRHKKICNLETNFALKIENYNSIHSESESESESEVKHLSYIEDENEIIEHTDEHFKITEEMFMMILNQSKEMMEVIKNGTHNMTNCLNTNNNTFNLQVFLNETCKDAINMKDFIESIDVTIKDLKILGKVGYVEGISGLMIKKLNDLDVTKRPIHSSDVKRETVYIKENNIWEKDNYQKKHLKKVLLQIAQLETRALVDKYKIMYPQCETDRDSKEHDEYWRIFHQAIGGAEKNMDILHSKVIKRIVQNVAIDKNIC